jgi:hypothetical protein
LPAIEKRNGFFAIGPPEEALSPAGKRNSGGDLAGKPDAKAKTREKEQHGLWPMEAKMKFGRLYMGRKLLTKTKFWCKINKSNS